MKGGCGEKCRYNCHQTFSAEDREAIFHGYYQLGELRSQREFIIRVVRKVGKRQSIASAGFPRYLKNLENLEWEKFIFKVLKTLKIEPLDAKTLKTLKWGFVYLCSLGPTEFFTSGISGSPPDWISAAPTSNVCGLSIYDRQLWTVGCPVYVQSVYCGAWYPT